MSTTTAGSNMAGNDKRAVLRVVSQILTPELNKLNGEEAERLKAELSGFRGDIAPTIVAALRRRSALAWDPSLVAFTRNAHGHIEFDILGMDLSGAEEVERLLAAEYRVSDYAKSCFMNTGADSYDARHRLEPGERLRIALMPHSVIERDDERTTDGLRTVAAERFGYGRKPKAGILPRIREAVSDKQMEEWGFRYIVALHDPITGARGRPSVLGASRRDGGRWVGAGWGRPGGQWYVLGASAFSVPAST